MDYRGKVVVITASSGIGRDAAVASHQAARSWSARRKAREPFAGARRRVPLPASRVRRELPCGETSAKLRLRRARHPRHHRAARTPDVLINNAGILIHKQIYDVTPGRHGPADARQLMMSV